MTDRIILPLAGIGTLVLDGDAYRAALAEGAKLTAPESPPSPTSPALVDAEQLGELTNTKASWWEAAARESDCPSVFVGKYRRFNVAECLAWLSQVQERDGNGRVRRCGVVPRAGT
jgi:hypothetical protein